MKKLSGNGIIVCASLLITSITSTLNANTTQPIFTAPFQIKQEINYTASGKTDKKTAMLFQQLMKNNKNLQIHAEVMKRPAPQRNRQIEVAVNYTIHSKTDMKTLRKLVKLFQSNQEIYVRVTANVKANKTKRNLKVEESKPQKNPNLYNNSKTAYVYNHRGYPPIYLQGNSMWYQVPVMAQSIATQETPKYPVLSGENAPFPMDYSAHYNTRIAAR